MKKLLFSLPLALAAIGAALAQAPSTQSDPNTGVMTLAFGRVKNPDGTWRSVKGLQIPYRMERISARVVPPGQGTVRDSGRVRSDEKAGGPASFGPENSLAYLADSPADYVVTPIDEFPSASVADGARLAAVGAGRAWQELTVGIDSYSTARVLVRWRVWRTLQTGTGSGQNVFVDSIGDFGGYFNLPGIGTNKVTFNVALAGITAPGQDTFFAQQFRTPRPAGTTEDGNGPFRNDVQSVFSCAAPSIGTSEQTYWYDFLNGDPDGIYEADELEALGDGSGSARISNLLLGIRVSTRPTESATNTSFNWLRGIAISGDLFSLSFDDNDFLIGQRGPVLTSAESPIQLITESRVPAGTTLLTLSYEALLRVNTPSLQVRTALWDWQAGQWVQLTANPATTTKATYGTFAQGNLQRFLNAQGTVRGRIQVFQTGPVLTSGYRLLVDQVQVRFVRP